MRKRTSRLERRARPAVLLAIDMLNGFLDPKGKLYCGDEARKIIPFVKARIQQYHRGGRPVIFVCDSHAENDPEFDKWPPHCVRGTWEARIIPELPTRQASVIRKTTLSCFYRTSLQRRLREISPEVVEVVGVCANICVLFATADLASRGYRCRVPRKGVATFDRKSHRAALELMQSAFGAEVV